MEDLSGRPTASIPLASAGWAETKAAYRLLDNAALDGGEMLEVHTHRTRERMQGQAVVLCNQDTTELDLTSQPRIAGSMGCTCIPRWWSPPKGWPGA